jgi:hypothetical protein
MHLIHPVNVHLGTMKKETTKEIYTKRCARSMRKFSNEKKNAKKRREVRGE